MDDDPIVCVLRAAAGRGLAISPREAAEIAWLSTVSRPAAERPAREPDDAPPASAEAHEPPPGADDFEESAVPASTEQDVKVDVEVGLANQSQRTAGRGAHRESLHVRGSAALADRLGFLRTLHGLAPLRSTDGPPVLDVAATVRRIAERDGELELVMRPSSERRAQLIVIEDVAPSMDPWRGVGSDLAHLGARTGAFTYVDALKVDLSAPDRPVFLRRGKPLELARVAVLGHDPVVLFVSDGLGPSIVDGRLGYELLRLPPTTLIAWLHPWGERRWRRTPAGALRVGRPGPIGAAAAYRGIAVPVAGLEPRGLRVVESWVQGRSGGALIGRRLPVVPPSADDLRATDVPEGQGVAVDWAEEALRLSGVLERPTFELLALAAAVPGRGIDADLLHSLGGSFVESQAPLERYHLAEAMTSGFLQRVETPSPDHVVLGFRSLAAREALRGFLDRKRVAAVLEFLIARYRERGDHAFSRDLAIPVDLLMRIRYPEASDGTDDDDHAWDDEVVASVVSVVRSTRAPDWRIDAALLRALSRPDLRAARGTTAAPEVAGPSRPEGLGGVPSVPYERLPYPFAVCWIQAEQAQTAAVVHRSSEFVMRALLALVLADVLDLDWPESFAKLFDASEGDLERLTLGQRMERIHHAIKVHAGATHRVLPDLTAWWRDAARDAWALADMRNASAHAPSLADEAPDEARDRLAAFLCSATWLQEIQLAYLPREQTRQLGSNVWGLIRLRGVNPFAALTGSPDLMLVVGPEIHSEIDVVYLGRGDGTLWTLNPFMGTDKPHVFVLDQVRREGTLFLLDPAAGSPEVLKGLPGVPDPNRGWKPIPWARFLAERKRVTDARAWRQAEQTQERDVGAHPSADAALVRGQRVGHYQLIEERGFGGFAVVWEAEEVHTRERFALKMVKGMPGQSDAERRNASDQLERECELLQHLADVPRLIGPVESFPVPVVGGYPHVLHVLRMPLLARSLGEEVKGLRDSGRPPTLEQVVAWGAQTLEGLEALHARGVVHRDIKPSNLLLDARGEVVITDLGIALSYKIPVPLTGPLEPLGSAMYAAPEQSEHPNEVGGRSDVYSLAVTLHELLSGKASRAVGKGIAAPLGDLLRRMGEPDHQKRPTSAEALVLFRNLLATTGVSREPATPSRTAQTEAEECARAEQLLAEDGLHEGAFETLERLYRGASRWEELATLYVGRHDRLEEAGRFAAAVPFMVRAARVYDAELGDHEQALAAAQLAFREDATNSEAVTTLESITRATNQWNEVLRFTIEAYSAEPAGPRKTQLGLHAARWYGLELGHPEWAIPIYTQILAAEPGNLQALGAQGELYRRLGQWQPLAKTLQRAVEVARSPEDRRTAHVQLGEVYEKNLKQPAQAVVQFHAALAIDGNDGAAMTALARVHAAAEDWHALVDVLRRYVATVADPAEIAELRVRIGSVLEDRAGDLEGAAAEYGAVLEADPTNLAAMRGLEGIYLRLGRSRELLGVLEQQLEVVAIERERIKLLTRIGGMLEEEFVRPALAIERFERVLEIDPSHDPSLRALERLYRQTGQWNELIGTLERHLTATSERRDRVPIFLQMGRLYADEKRDLDRAEDAFLNVLQIDAENADALDSLARVYESRNDWHRAADVLEVLAQDSSDPMRAVGLRMRAGRIAETSQDDELRAVEQYRAALDLDPNHLPALEALRSISTRREDWYEVARYLDREQAATKLPRARAKLLTELGRLSAQHLDDQAQSIRCYEEALRCDPNQEEAAWPLCNDYVSERRWSDAEPLAEMLTRRASRRDPAEQLQIQLTMGRIAVALGKGDRAIKAFTAAQALDRANVESISALALAYFDKQDWDNAFKHYQVLLAHHKEELGREQRADLYCRLGAVKAAQGDRRRAVNFLEKSLEEYPGYRPALGALIDTHSAGSEWEQAIGYRTQLLDMEDDEEKRFSMLIEIGTLWHEKVRNRQKAIQCLARASELKSKDRALLHRLLGLYTEAGQWSKVVDTTQRVSDLESSNDRRAAYASAIAAIYDDKLKDPDEALTFYNQALDFNPGELKPFVKVNEILTARRDWKALERNYRAMLRRVIGRPDTEDLQFNLLHSLGVIYRDRLTQPDAALRAFQMASERRPDDLQEHKILAELATQMGDSAEAITRWRAIAERDIGNVEAMHAIYDLYYQSRQYDKAWCVAATTSFLLRSRTREDLRAFFEQYRPRGPLQPAGRLTEEHWVKQLFHPDEDPVAGKIFAAVLGAVRRTKVKPLRQFGFTERELQDPAESTVTLVRALVQSSQALNLPLPSIFLKPQQRGGLGHVPSEPVASFAGADLLSGLRPEELAFVAAKHMTYYRNEHYIRALLPTTQELTVMLLAAIRLVKPNQEVPQEAIQTAQILAPLMAHDPIAVEGLRKVVEYFLRLGGTTNIVKWYQSVELTAGRAGFLMCGDLEVARKMLALEPGLPGDLGPGEQLKSVVIFSMSEEYFSLRDALGINFEVQAPSPFNV